MKFDEAADVRVRICASLIDAIYDECDRYDEVETGGRLVGTYDDGDDLTIDVTGLIDAGPGATRSATSLFQDGDYQYDVFREIERDHPEIEHLGTWHTHHVNGYPRLSAGDIATYRRTVNHDQHNTDFLYALLVVDRAQDDRYAVRHYLLRRGDDRVYEIPASQVELVDRPAVRNVPDLD